MNLFKIIFISLFFNLTYAEDFLDISTDKIIGFNWPETYLALTITSQCAHCETQLKVLKACEKTSKAIVFFDNKEKLNSVKLNRYVRSKNWSPPLFLLDESLKKKFDYKGVTPHLYIKNKKDIKIYNGVVSCGELEKILNS